MKRSMVALLALVLGSSFACRRGKPEPAGEGPAKAKSEKHDDEAKEAKSGKGGGHAEEEGHGHEKEAVIELAPEAVRSAAIKTTKAVRKPLAAGLTVAARIALNGRKVAKVAPRVPGRLAKVTVGLGDKVKQGAVLAVIESPELGKTRAAYMAAATRARIAHDNFLREQDLVAKGISSQREMREAEGADASAQADLESADAALHALGLTEAEIRSLKRNDHLASQFPVRSPLAGTVLEIVGTLGQSIEATTHLLTVADLDELWVLADVYENQLQFVKVGQKVSLEVAAVPGRRFEGRIDYIGEMVEEKSRAVEVRVVVPNRERILKPGMFATAEITPTPGALGTPDAGSAGQLPLVVPRDAVQQVGGEHVVFVAEGPGRFKPVDVKVGRRSAADAEILQGLKEGAEVVVQGAFVLKSELSKESMGEGHAH